eukprot:gene19037-20950_t
MWNGKQTRNHNKTENVSAKTNYSVHFADQMMSNYSYNGDSNIPSDNAYSNVQQQNLSETHFSQQVEVDSRNQARPISTAIVVESQEVWTIPVQENITLPSAPPPSYSESVAVAGDQFLSVAPPCYATAAAEQINNNDTVGSNEEEDTHPGTTLADDTSKTFPHREGICAINIWRIQNYRIFAASVLENIPLCDNWNCAALCSIFRVSVVFGFTAMVLFILDTAAHYIRYKTE